MGTSPAISINHYFSSRQTCVTFGTSYDEPARRVDKKYGAKYVAVVRKWMEDNLPRIIDALGIVSEVASCEKVSDKIIAAQKAINLLPENLNATMWSSLSALLANSLADDGKLSISEALAIVGYVYENNLNKD